MTPEMYPAPYASTTSTTVRAIVGFLIDVRLAVYTGVGKDLGNLPPRLLEAGN